jgi:transcriptional regulator with XRE-family HTH domain
MMEMTLGQRLKEARESRELTQVELGRLIGVTDATINRYEKDLRSPDPSTLKKLASVLETSVDYLLETTKGPDHDFEQLWPEGIKVRRAHNKLSDTERGRMLRLINAFIKEAEDEAEKGKK